MTKFRSGPNARVAVAGFMVMFLIGSATDAYGHAKAKKNKFPAGSRQTLSFVVEHGCGSSPTTKLAVKLPKGVTKPTPINPKGWTSNVKGDLVTWSGGSLAANVKATFELTVTLPTTKGTHVFPMVQTCVKGTLRWIEGPKSDYPAPVITTT